MSIERVGGIVGQVPKQAICTACLRVHPHSTKSEIPIWKCVWCRERLGKVTEVQAKLLESYVKKFGWPNDPLIFHEDGGIHAYGSKA